MSIIELQKTESINTINNSSTNFVNKLRQQTSSTTFVNLENRIDQHDQHRSTTSTNIQKQENRIDQHRSTRSTNFVMNFREHEKYFIKHFSFVPYFHHIPPYILFKSPYIFHISPYIPLQYEKPPFRVWRNTPETPGECEKTG